MNKIQIYFILFFLTASLHGKRIPNLNREGLPRIRLRTFPIYSLKILSEMAKIYEERKKLEDEMKNHEMKLINEKMIKEEMERTKIFQQYLVSRHGSSNFLNDIHVDRYF